MIYEVTNRKRNIFYQIVFFTGLILMIWEISIFRKTVINPGFLFLIIIGIGCFATMLDYKHYVKTYAMSRRILLVFAFLQNTISWGFIACSILLLSNYYLADSEIKTEKYKIVKKSSMPGSEHNRSDWQPLIQIMYKGKLKELVFDHKYYEEMNAYNYVDIETRKGYWDWDIITSQELEK